MAKKKHNPNYTCEIHDTPMKVMGEGDFANMPKKARIQKFPDNPQMVGGIIGNFVKDITELSGIQENGS